MLPVVVLLPGHGAVSGYLLFRLLSTSSLFCCAVIRGFDVPLATELDLLVTHGVLHLIGYDDRDPVEARLMHERERQILSAGRRQPPARLWRGLLDALPARSPRTKQVRVDAVSGDPRAEPALRRVRRAARADRASSARRSTPRSRAFVQ